MGDPEQFVQGYWQGLQTFKPASVVAYRPVLLS